MTGVEDLENYAALYPDPPRSAILEYVHVIGYPLDRDDEQAQEAVELLGEVMRNPGEYVKHPTRRHLAAAWIKLHADLDAEITARLETREMPMSSYDFSDWADPNRGMQVVFRLYRLSQAGTIWRYETEYDEAIFGLPHHAKPRTDEEAFEWLELAPEDYPLEPPVHDDGSVQPALFT